LLRSRRAFTALRRIGAKFIYRATNLVDALFDDTTEHESETQFFDLRGLQDLCRNVPLVAVDSDFGFQAPSVVIDNELGSRIATRHLIDRGHRKIGYLQGPLGWRASRLRFYGLAE
jgi:DNA-binding LacI/PurR family transcriptional regulator